MTQSTSSTPNTLPTWLPLVLLIATLMAIFYRLLLGQVLYWGLPSLQFYPWREFAMAEFAQGRFPLWNPYNGAGVPLLANYQSALLYPPHALYWLYAGPQMMGFLGLLHLAWAGLGMWLLSGQFGLPALGRGIASLSFALSSTIVARFGTIPMVDVAAWLPWLMLTVHMLLQRVSLWRFLAVVSVLAIQLLAGHAQWTFYSLALTAGYAVWVIIAERRPAWLFIVASIMALALAIGIAAAQLAPTAELQRESQRASGVDEDYALNFSYPWLSILTLFNPNFFGNPGNGTYAVNGAYFETTAYIGMLPVVLAILGTAHYAWLRLRRRAISGALPDHLMLFFALVAAICLVLATGKYGIYRLLYRYLPTFNMFQAPARWLLLTVFALSVLAGTAVSFWKANRLTRRTARLALAGAVSVTVAGLLSGAVLRGASPIIMQLGRGLTSTGILLFGTTLLFVMQPLKEQYVRRWSILVLLFVAGDLWSANALSNPTVDAKFYDKQQPETSARVFRPDAENRALPEAAFDQYLALNDYQQVTRKLSEYRASALPNLNLLDRQPSFNSFEPLRPEGFERYSRLLNQNLRPALFRAAAIGTMIGQAAPSGMANDTPRVWLVTSAQFMPDAAEATAALAGSDWSPERSVVIQGQSGSISTANSQPGTAQIVSENPQELNIAVNTSSDQILVVADTYYPGWIATVDGQPAALLRANLAFRAVAVPAGQHSVRMLYQPRSFQIGGAVSIISLLVYVLMLVTVLIRLRMRSAIISIATRL